MNITRRMMVAATAAMLSPRALADEAFAPLIFHAGQAGRLTQDRDRTGGNPFASALIEVLGEERLPLSRFRQRLGEANMIRSGGWQQLDAPRTLPAPDWRIDAMANATHRAVALVLINSDYSHSPGVLSLPGSKVDAARLPAALRAAGFETRLVLDADVATAHVALAEFAQMSASAETALIYVGGHGVQHGRTVWQLAGDYPAQDAKWLTTHATQLSAIAAAAGRAAPTSRSMPAVGTIRFSRP